MQTRSKARPAAAKRVAPKRAPPKKRAAVAKKRKLDVPVEIPRPDDESGESDEEEELEEEPEPVPNPEDVAAVNERLGIAFGAPKNVVETVRGFIRNFSSRGFRLDVAKLFETVETTDMAIDMWNDLRAIARSPEAEEIYEYGARVHLRDDTDPSNRIYEDAHLLTCGDIVARHNSGDYASIPVIRHWNVCVKLIKKFMGWLNSLAVARRGQDDSFARIDSIYAIMKAACDAFEEKWDESKFLSLWGLPEVSVVRKWYNHLRDSVYNKFQAVVLKEEQIVQQIKDSDNRYAPDDFLNAWLTHSNVYLSSSYIDLKVKLVILTEFIAKRLCFFTLPQLLAYLPTTGKYLKWILQNPQARILTIRPVDKIPYRQGRNSELMEISKFCELFDGAAATGISISASNETKEVSKLPDSYSLKKDAGGVIRAPEPTFDCVPMGEKESHRALIVLYTLALRTCDPSMEIQQGLNRIGPTLSANIARMWKHVNADDNNGQIGRIITNLRAFNKVLPYVSTLPIETRESLRPKTTDVIIGMITGMRVAIQNSIDAVKARFSTSGKSVTDELEIVKGSLTSLTETVRRSISSIEKNWVISNHMLSHLFAIFTDMEDSVAELCKRNPNVEPANLVAMHLERLGSHITVCKNATTQVNAAFASAKFDNMRWLEEFSDKSDVFVRTLEHSLNAVAPSEATDSVTIVKKITLLGPANESKTALDSIAEFASYSASLLLTSWWMWSANAIRRTTANAPLVGTVYFTRSLENGFYYSPNFLYLITSSVMMNSVGYLADYGDLYAREWIAVVDTVSGKTEMVQSETMGVVGCLTIAGRIVQLTSAALVLSTTLGSSLSLLPAAAIGTGIAAAAFATGAYFGEPGLKYATGKRYLARLASIATNVATAASAYNFLAPIVAQSATGLGTAIYNAYVPSARDIAIMSAVSFLPVPLVEVVRRTLFGEKELTRMLVGSALGILRTVKGAASPLIGSKKEDKKSTKDATADDKAKEKAKVLKTRVDAVIRELERRVERVKTSDNGRQLEEIATDATIDEPLRIATIAMTFFAIVTTFQQVSALG